MTPLEKNAGIAADNADLSRGVSLEEALRIVKDNPQPRANRAPEQLAKLQEIVDRIHAMADDDYGATDASENLDDYIYEQSRHLTDGACRLRGGDHTCFAIRALGTGVSG